MICGEGEGLLFEGINKCNTYVVLYVLVVAKRIIAKHSMLGAASPPEVRNSTEILEDF